MTVHTSCTQKSFSNVKTVWVEYVKRHAKEDVCMMLVGNKCDQTDKIAVDFITAKVSLYYAS